MSRILRYDFFLAHAGADVAAAEELYQLLLPDARVFLDSKTLLPGDDWDHELSSAQKESLITVVLVSSRSGEAYYQREEIAAAIAMAREDKSSHRVVPVYINDLEKIKNTLPYGLRIKHGLSLDRDGGLGGVAERLKALLVQLTQSGEKKESPPIPKQATASKKDVSIKSSDEFVIRCAACKGTGTRDRDGRPPSCSVCNGAGHVIVQGSEDTFKKCAFCEGDGSRDRDGRPPVCPVCSGIGGYIINSPVIPCAACAGTGSRDRDKRPPICPSCGGKGVLNPGKLRKY